jgi:hypothetical protein
VGRAGGVSQVATIGMWLRELEREHGSMRKAAEHYDIDPGYWTRLKHGEKENPSEDLLQRLGLRQACALYVRSA